MSSEPPFLDPPPPPDDAPPPPPPYEPPSGSTPWERRGQIGFASALAETTQQVLLQPKQFFEGMAVTGGVGSPLLYALILGYLSLVVNAIYGLIFRGVFGAGAFGFGKQSAEFDRLRGFLESWVGTTVQLITGPIWIVIGAFVAAGILHVMLMILGGANRDFEATFRVVAYGHAVNIVALLPFCGSFISVIWWIVVAVIGLATVHRTSIGQALAAVLVPILVCCCCCAGMIGLFAGAIASFVERMR